MNSSGSEQGPVARFCEHFNESLDSLQGGNFVISWPYHLYWLVREDCSAELCVLRYCCSLQGISTVSSPSTAVFPGTVGSLQVSTSSCSLADPRNL
jgi:hypothetical protein